MLHLGDYIYEYGPGEYGYGQGDVDIRPHEPAHEILTLADYRQRHAQYKRDPDLQRLHAKYAFIATWDDHESANDAYKDGAENHTDGARAPGQARRAASHQAYDEWMPVRMSGTAALGDGDQLFRRLQFGDLAEISMLDLRSYRDKQLAAQVDPDVRRPGPHHHRSEQMDWLKGSLARPAAQWKLVGNPVMISPVTFAGVPRDLVKPVNDTVGLLPPEGVPYNVDQWDGYTDDRREVFEHLRDNGVTDTLFITGDIHSGWACDLPADKATYAGTRNSVGVEFVATSVTSSNLKDITGTPRARRASRSRRSSRPTTRTSSTSTSTTTASRSSTSPRSERRWTGSSSATAPTRRPASAAPVRGRPRREARWSSRRHAIDEAGGADVRARTSRASTRPSPTVAPC